MKTFRLTPLRWIALVLIALLAGVADARGAASSKPASAPASSPTPPPGEIVWEKPSVTVKPGAEPVRVLTLEDPKITRSTYAIRGRLKYQDVKGTGYLEMWSHFPDGSRFFSRTLDRRGPMQVLEGSSDWREFILPFSAKSGTLPSKLEVNLVLPEGGTVQLEAARLVQPFDLATVRTGAGEWWTDRQGGILGAVLGSGLGILGGVIGTLAGAGRARRLVLSLALTSIIVCSAALLLGIAALAIRQPYAVWYPLVLTGTIGTIIFGSLFPTMKRRYAEQELRRMSALDAAA